MIVEKYSVQPRMGEKNLDRVVLEGIKERLEDMAEDDMYTRYGQLVAQGVLEFSRECMEDSARLASEVTKAAVGKKNSLSW